MATRVKIQARLYITEHMEAHDVDDAKLAERLGRARETIWRWRRKRRGLTADKQAEIAHGLGILPEDLWRPPSKRASVDAVLAHVDDDDHETVLRTAKRLAARRT